MPDSQGRRDPFVLHLEELRQRGDRGALAALRRGLGRPPGTVPDMYPHVLPWARDRWREDACYLVGSLFALHSEGREEGNMGTAFAIMRSRDTKASESLERRFIALLNSHRDELATHLRSAVSLLKAKDVPVNWHRLLRDILYWDHESHFIQQNWAREFWGREATAPSEIGEPEGP